MIAMVGAFTAAQAYETKFGDVSITFDTTVSMGVSVKTASIDERFLPEGNGGPVDPRNGTNGNVVINLPVATLAGLGGNATYTRNPDNFDGSINTDDGRLNFDRGDLTGANVKANHDLLVKWENYTVFARAVGFYDVILNDKDAGNRSELTDAALGDVGRNYELLDLFVSADYTVGELPVNLRVGKQVINWGESTFILGGNNVFNPIDVGAFRRPGSEIKEALVPVNAVSGTVSFPFDVSLSAYYALDWEPFEVDPSGTPFSNVDILTRGSGALGNVNRISFIGGGPFAGGRRNCTAGATTGTRRVQLDAASTLAGSGLLAGGAGSTGGDPTVATAGRIDCLDDPTTGIAANALAYNQAWATGYNEYTRQLLVDTLGSQGYTMEVGAGIERRDDVFARDSGQFGVAAKLYVESLGGTEFGFYYQNYHSRLPIISEVVDGAPVLSIAVQGDSAQATAGGIGSRQLLPAGCGFAPAMSLPVANATAAGTLNAVNSVGFGGDLVNRPVLDPQNLLDPAVNAALVQAGFTGLQLTANTGGSYDHVLNAMRLNCALAYYQSTDNLAASGFGLQLVNGAETLVANPNLGLIVEYPEDIETFGFSFNTTLGGWGVQGDFTYRKDAPFQADTDSLTIAGVWYGCTFQVASPAGSTSIGGPTGVLTTTRESDASNVAPQCLPNSGIGQKISGVIRNDMYQGQIGTTATFTGSDWWVAALGAALGVVVTEVGFAYVPDVEARNEQLLTPTAANGTRLVQYQNTGCNGSNLGLGGLLGLDGKNISQCRPTDLSGGLVMLFRTEYNNFLDSGFTVAPQLVYSWDFTGTTPAPYSTFLEDRQTIGVGVTGTLNNNLRLGVNYSNFFGGHINNKASDQDFASVSASYSF